MTADIVVQDREELVFLLCEAAEFEHAVMCTYLYAMWSLKREESEGVTRDELEAIGRWRASLRQVAREEMLHLALVNNLLAALGNAPHLWKPEFPVRSGHFPADVVMKLMPFSAAALDHFLYIERPEGLDIRDGKGFDHKDHYARAARPDLLSPVAQDYVSQGHLYHGILHGLIDLAEQLGEEETFVGHDQAQVSGMEFGLPGLFKVTDLASAKRAIEEIVTQGEGAPAHSENSHYARFAQMKQELAALRAKRPAFEPSRAAAENPTLIADGRVGVTHVSNAQAVKTVDLGNAIYALMMRTLAQVFSPAPLPKGLRAGMAIGSTELMLALQLVGEAATRLSANGTSTTAGVTFSLPRSAGQLVQSCAGQILSERARELGAAASALEAYVNLSGVGARLGALARRFDELHERFEEHLTLAVERTATLEPPPPAPASGDPNVAYTKDITVRFDTKRCIHSRHCVLEAPKVFRANTKGAWIHAESASVEHIVRVAMNCPSGAITYARHDGGLAEPAPEVNVIAVRENGPYAVNAAVEMGNASFKRATLCRCGRSQNKPYCDNSHIKAFAATGEPATIENDPLEFHAGPLSIDPLQDGPLQLLGNVEIVTGTGRTIIRAQNARLCRCGASSTKPFCDGTHARVGFKS